MSASDALTQTLHSAAARLRWARLAGALSRALLIGAVASCAVLAAARLWPVPWAGWAAVGLVIASAVAGLIAGFFPRVDLVGAALHLDRDLNLRERLSTAAVCLGRSDAPAREVVRDAAAQLPKLDLRRDCPVVLPREAPALFAAALCAAALAGLSPARAKPSDPAAIVRDELEQILDAIDQAQQATASAAGRRSLDALRAGLRGARTPAQAARRIATALAQIEARRRNIEALSDLARAALAASAHTAIDPQDEQALRTGARSLGQKIDKGQLRPDQRKALEQALRGAAQRIDDPELQRSLREALDALAREDGQRAAQALEKLLLGLVAQVRLEQLVKLQQHLADARERIDQAAAEGGDLVDRGTQPGERSGPQTTSPVPDGVEQAYWESLPVAQARAERAVASGALPERHRELVRRYFARPTE